MKKVGLWILSLFAMICTYVGIDELIKNTKPENVLPTIIFIVLFGIVFIGAVCALKLKSKYSYLVYLIISILFISIDLQQGKVIKIILIIIELLIIIGILLGKQILSLLDKIFDKKTNKETSSNNENLTIIQPKIESGQIDTYNPLDEETDIFPETIDYQEACKRATELTLEDWRPEMHSYSNNSEEDDSQNYVNDLEAYEIRTPGEPIIVGGYQLTNEEMEFTRYLSNEIQLCIPNASIKLSTRVGPIINYQIFVNCQICRFQFNEKGKKLQVLSKTNVYWYDVKSIKDAIRYIPRIVKYATQLGYSEFSKIWNPFSDSISHINLYYNCCYTLEVKEECKHHIRIDFPLKSDKEQYERYKKVLGDDCPSSISEFNKIKYTSPEDWECLKSVYRKANRKQQIKIKEGITNEK